MPIHTAVWLVGQQPRALAESSLASERLLEDMIVASPSILSNEWMLIGRQENTGFDGRIDLLAIARDGSLILIEIKRARTPREVVAQAIDYASWVEELSAEEIAAIYGRFAPGRSLGGDFRKCFGQELDEESLNGSHQIIIVASTLDRSSERIVEYLSKRNIPMNVLCFQVFTHGSDQLLARSWLLDPVSAQASASALPSAHSEPWNGEVYCSFGEGESRSWEDAVEFGFVCGGGDAWYSRTLQLLSVGDRVWVNVPRVGYVGVGRVIGSSIPASSFLIPTPSGEVTLLSANPTRQLPQAIYRRLRTLRVLCASQMASDGIPCECR